MTQNDPPWNSESAIACAIQKKNREASSPRRNKSFQRKTSLRNLQFATKDNLDNMEESDPNFTSGVMHDSSDSGDPIPNNGNGQDDGSGGGPSKPKKKSGIFGASSNLINSIVGAGIIGMPYAMKQSGLIAGVLLLVLIGWMTDKSLRMIVDMATFHPQLRKLDVHTYEDLASYPFGRGGSAFILFNMFILAYGAMVAYLLIIKDTVPTIFGVGDTWERELILFLSSLFIVVPLSMLRDMASLAFTSLLSVAADIILVIFVAVYAPIKETVSAAGGFGEVLRQDWINPTIFIGLGVLSTAMACQHSCFIISGSLSNGTRARWSAVTYRSLFVATTASGVMGVCGYLGFLSATQGDILNNFPSTGVEANVARGLLAFTMLFTYPMESFVARHVLIKLVHNGDMDGEAAAEADEANVNPGFLCLGRRQAWTLAIYVMALIPALIVDDLGPVLSITGSLGGSCVAYIAPGIIFLGLHGDEFLGMITGSLESRQSKKSGDSATGDIELPVAGDANTTMTQTAEATATHKEMAKPWWWFLLLMPIWCAIASTGSSTSKSKLSARSDGDGVLQAPSANGEGRGALDEDDDLVAHRMDFCVAIFFIIFGVIAVVAGILSNIYVQINGIFFTPH